jgi:hypothetical protein
MSITSAAGPDAAPRKQTLSTNYLDFTDGSTGWEQQYLPDLMEKEAEIYGKRTISGFLSQIGAEEASQSDSVVWSEQGRLHLAYKGTVTNAANSTITITTDVDGNTVGSTHGIRVGDTVLISGGNVTLKAYVTVSNTGLSSPTAVITVAPYAQEALVTNSSFANTNAVTVLVYGSEFNKGTDGRNSANAPQFKSYTNKHLIMKDFYEVSGSDTSAIGWVEVTGEEGQSGYLWYLKAEGDTRARFSDYLEMSMMESELNDGTALLIGGTDKGEKESGTEGLFAAIKARGNVTTDLGASGAAANLASFDAILATFDAQGAIEENMMFLNRAQALKVDDMLAGLNPHVTNGVSFGVFDNAEDMALNLGFSGFRRGSYDFYKTDWKYLNDKGTRGVINSTAGTSAIRGVIIPAGTSTVYDEQIGKNLKRPFLHVRYRSSETDDRKMKTWVTGSVGASTSGKDVMEVHYLSERCLVTQGANNFMLIQ